MNGHGPKSTGSLPSQWASRTSTGAEWSVTTSFEVAPVWSPSAAGSYFISGRRVKAVVLRFGDPDESPRLRVEWDGGGRIVSVRLTDPEGLTATALQRFPWARWLTVADGALRTFSSPYGQLDGLRILAALEHDERLERALSGERLRPRPDPSRRPGRAGHPNRFYAEIARDYTALRQQGSLRPTADLAKQRRVSRDTMAGWVRRARERGLLPEARGNRPG
jgi:hypothetical protein